MEVFKRQPKKQTLPFNSEELADFDIHTFLDSLIQPSKMLDLIVPTPVKFSNKRKLPFVVDDTKPDIVKKNLLFNVKKIGKIIIRAMDCGFHTIHETSDSHVFYNRIAFYNYIKQMLMPYAAKLEQEQSTQTCDSMTTFKLLSHQEIVRQYINSHTPYRGLLLYHGLGSGKTCSSIAIAENMKEYKQIIVMCPASLKTNYIKELKKCGDPKYNAALHHWKWLRPSDPEFEPTLQELCITRKKGQGIWATEDDAEPNFADLTSEEQLQIQMQIDEVIIVKYQFIHYNGLSTTSRIWNKLLRDEKSQGNPFHNKVIIVDEAHNLISRIINKLGSKHEQIALTLYKWLKTAENCKIILLSGTPMINSPYEFSILYNILRGTNTVYTFTNNQTIPSQTVLEQNQSNPIIREVDVVDTSNPSKFLITKCPHNFTLTQNKMKLTTSTEYDSGTTDKDFISNIEKTLKCTHERTEKYDTLPEDQEEFEQLFLSANMDKNLNMLMRRISGLTSYYPDMVSLMPRLNPPEIITIPMPRIQFEYYEAKRIEEREQEKKSKAKKIDDKSSNSYKIKSRLACNFVFPEEIARPKLNKEDKDFGDIFEDEEYELTNEEQKEQKQEDKEDRQSLNKCYKEIYSFFSKNSELVPTYAPKFDAIANKIQRINGSKSQLHLVYSQFLTLEGLNLFSLILQLPAYGNYVAFDIKKNKESNKWTIPDNIKPDQNKYVLYTGAMEPERREIIRNIFNNDMDGIPSELQDFVKKMTPITIFMITAAGAEGISLKRVQHVHIMEPYWNPIRIDQVIGRARRICSHSKLPKEEQFVNVYKYIMSLPADKKEGYGDVFRKDPDPVTTDEYLMKLSFYKDELIHKFQSYIQDSSIDCFLHKNTCFSIPIENPNSMLINYNSNLEKDKSLPISDDVYLRFKKHLDTISSVIGNKYIYDMFYEHTYKTNQLNIKTMNSYEACFIAQIIRAYVSHYKKKTIHFVDIGTGQGTSSIVVLNELLQFPEVNYTSIDPINTGQPTILQFLKYVNSKNITPKFIEQTSDIAMTELTQQKAKLNIISIDGDSTAESLTQDIQQSDALLVKQGILILSNVNLPHVKEAITTLLPGYNRISIEANKIKVEKDLLLDKENPESIVNSSTLYCFQKK